MKIKKRVFDKAETKIERRPFVQGYRLVLSSDRGGPKVTVFAFDGNGVSSEAERLGWALPE